MDIEKFLSWSKPVRIIDISQNILNSFTCLFRKINILVTLQKKMSLFVLQKEYYAPNRWTCVEDNESHLCWMIETFYLCTRRLPEHTVFRRNRFPINLKMLLSSIQTRVNPLHIVNAVTFFTLFCKVISALLRMVCFAIIKLDNFYQSNLITR